MSQGPIYTGVWRNYDSATGSTIILTVPQDVGALLTAFLALFVSFSFGHLWSIICFVLHQVRSAPQRPSGIYHQRQALLRNTTTAAATAWTSAKLAWVWRGNSRGVVGGSAALVSVAVSFVALLATASLLSSKIQLVNGDVLLSGQECGWINITDRSKSGKYSAKESFRVWLSNRAERYSVNCYGPEAANGSETGACGGFPANTIPVTTSIVPCPFGKAICAQSDAFRLDSGFIDSNHHLGINSPPEYRIRFRKITTCAPIQTEKYSTGWDTEPPSSMRKTGLPAASFYKTFNLGPIVNLEPIFNISHTWAVSNRTQFFQEDRGSPFVPYQLSAMWSTAAARNRKTAGWYPIPELTVPDADVILLILRNDARYLVPVSDPWFRSTSKTDLTGAGRQDGDCFMSGQTSATVACTEMYQLCNLTACNSPAGMPLGYPDWAVELNARQRAAVDLLGEAEYGSFEQLLAYGSLTPRASSLLSAGYGGIRAFNIKGLPPDQWQIEVSGMFNTTLAAMQLLASAQAAPPDITVPGPSGGAARLRDFLSPLRDDFSRTSDETTEAGLIRRGSGDMCYRERTRNLRHTNFAFVSYVAVLGAGIGIIATNLLCIPNAIFWLQRRLRKGREDQQEEWKLGHLFMMQRETLEARGIVGWVVGEDGEIPWMPKDGNLPLLGSEAPSVPGMPQDRSEESPLSRQP